MSEQKFGITFGDSLLSFIRNYDDFCDQIKEAAEQAQDDGIELYIAVYLKKSDLQNGVEHLVGAFEEKDLVNMTRSCGCTLVLRGFKAEGEPLDERIQTVAKRLELEYWSGPDWNKIMQHPWQ